MKQSRQDEKITHRAPVWRMAAAALAVGALSTSAFVVGTASAATSQAAKTVVISTFKTKKFGTFLVDGKTLYTLKGSKTACAAACNKIWPGVMLPKGETKAKAGAGVNAAKLGTVMRTGGAFQVTYSGKALYWFSGDKAPGQVTGNIKDLWGTWSYVATVKPSTPPPSTGGVAF